MLRSASHGQGIGIRARLTQLTRPDCRRDCSPMCSFSRSQRTGFYYSYVSLSTFYRIYYYDASTLRVPLQYKREKTHLVEFATEISQASADCIDTHPRFLPRRPAVPEP